MLNSSSFRSFSVLLGALLISSCSDSALRSPTAPVDSFSPQASEASSRTGALTGVLPSAAQLELRALWWSKRHKDAASVSRQIGPAGGTIEMPASGLTVVFPAGALRETKTITVTPDDKYVAYKMEPSGTTFDKDVVVTQLLSFTEITGAALRSQLFAAYIRDDNAKLSGKLVIPKADIQPSHTLLSPITGLPEAQVWVIRHFSRYMLSSG